MHPYIHARRTPDKPAYVMAGSGEVVTYRQLDERSNRVAQMFRARGLKPGDHIAIFMENNPRFFEICWGAQRAGLVYTPTSSRLNAAEVDYIAGDCGARLFITSKALAATAAEVFVASRGGIDVFDAGTGKAQGRWPGVPDGLTGVVPDEKLLEFISAQSDMQACADGLGQLALDMGSKDNVSCIVVETTTAAK